jgi:type II secretory pathway pseudopilin PulG
MVKNTRGQVWVETVIYTLVGLSIIGIVLGAATPKINQLRDKAVIGQTFELMGAIDSKIAEVMNYGEGNKRSVGVKVARGEFVIDAESDELKWIIQDSRYKFSEPGTPVENGNFLILTEGEGSPYTVTISLDYDYNLTYLGEDVKKMFEESPMEYKMVIDHKGDYINLNVE